MKPTNYKIVGITPPAAIIDNAAATTGSIDTLGFRFLEVFVYFGAMDIAATVCKIAESDNDSSYSDVTGLICGTSNNDTGSTSVLPTASYDNLFVKFEIPLQGRKRYIDLNLTLGDGSAGTYVAAFALLSQGDIDPTTAAQKGCAQVLKV